MNTNNFFEVAGTIENVEFLRTITAKKGENSGKSFNKYRVLIDGNEYFAFDEAYQEKIGKVGSWRYSENKWVDKIGVEHIEKTLIRLKNFKQKPTRNVIDEGKIIIELLTKISRNTEKTLKDIEEIYKRPELKEKEQPF